jgi:hypothetical protein
MTAVVNLNKRVAQLCRTQVLRDCSAGSYDCSAVSIIIISIFLSFLIHCLGIETCILLTCRLCVSVVAADYCIIIACMLFSFLCTFVIVCSALKT